jgi:hypothetical protein
MGRFWALGRTSRRTTLALGTRPTSSGAPRSPSSRGSITCEPGHGRGRGWRGGRLARGGGGEVEEGGRKGAEQYSRRAALPSVLCCALRPDSWPSHAIVVAAQHSTAQHRTAPHRTAPHRTALHRTAPPHTTPPPPTPPTPRHPMPAPLAPPPPRASGDSIPRINYTPEEVAVWGTALRELQRLFPASACREFLRTLPLFNFRYSPAGAQRVLARGWRPLACRVGILTLLRRNRARARGPGGRDAFQRRGCIVGPGADKLSPVLSTPLPPARPVPNTCPQGGRDPPAAGYFGRADCDFRVARAPGGGADAPA